jgi:uncharacterized protein DUF5906
MTHDTVKNQVETAEINTGNDAETIFNEPVTRISNLQEEEDAVSEECDDTDDKISESQSEEINKQDKEPNPTPNALKITKHKKLNKIIKEQLKDRFGCHWNSEAQAYFCPLKKEGAITAYLTNQSVSHTLEQAYDPYFEMTPNQQKAYRLEQARQMKFADFFKQMRAIDALINDYNKHWNTSIERKHLEKNIRESLTSDVMEDKQKSHLRILFEEYDKYEKLGSEHGEIDSKINESLSESNREGIHTSTKSDKVCIEDDEDEIGDENVELKKVTANARRRALINKATYDEIVKDVRKQHPTIVEKAHEIASKSLLWAKKYQLGNVVIVGGIPKTITDMKSLDSRFAQLEAPGQPCVIIHRSDAHPIADSDLKKRLSGEVVVSGVDDKGHVKYIDASKFWTGNAHKRIYKRIVFTNQNVDEETYNLFTSFGVKPKKGKCERILAHIKEVICAGNDKNTTALIHLLAWQIQNIGKPSRVIVMLKSREHQIGKGTLVQDILTVIYGNAGYTTSNLDQILGRFNDTIRGKAYIYLDEALFSGDRKAADALKSLATSASIGVETKGVPTVQLPIGVNLFLTTNHEDAAYIEEEDARYWILEVSPHRYKDTKYFDELYAEIENGGREAFMDYLLNLDVSGFLPARDVPKDNAAKDAMIRNSINPYDARKWLEACCNAEMILGYKTGDYKFPWEPWIKGREYVNGILLSAYAEWQKTVKSPVAPKPTPDNKFGELLNKAGFILRIDGQRLRTLPDLNECLKTVTEMIEKSGKK